MRFLKKSNITLVVLFAILVTAAGYGTAFGQAFTAIRIGDIDGLGYGVGTGYFAANNGPANVDGLGVLADGDFIPDLNRDHILATGRGDDFDNRSAAEIAGNFVTGIGFSNAGASDGSQFTDIALSTSFDATFPPSGGNNFPLPPSTSLSNQPGFVFDFEVLGSAIVAGQDLYLNVIFGDYDVTPASVIITRADGTTITLPVTVQSNPGGQDGLIQAAFTTLSFTDVFTALGTNWKGYLKVDFNAPREPYTTFDYAEISTNPIVGGPLEIECPDDYTLDCDQDPDPGVTGTATATGGFPPLTITYSDAATATSITRTWLVTDAQGNTTTCEQIITLTPSVGLIYGTLSADCPVGGISVDVFDENGVLVGSAVTSDAGNYSIEVESGHTYTVTFVAPLGYSADPNEKSVTVGCQDEVNCDFSLTCPDNAGEQRTIGFWKHQVGVATGGKGHAQVSASELCDLLDLIAAHFNSNGINEVAIYIPPVSGLCEDKLEVAKDLLNLKGNVSMTARAKQQLMALLLNVASGKLAQTAVISDDGATVSQAITYCDNLIDDPSGDHEKAKTIADEINNGNMVAAGMIPLSTAQIAYKGAPLPRQFALAQNYPNPFNAGTVINYSLTDAGHVTLGVYNVLGQRVVTLVDSDQSSGPHSVSWNGLDESGQTVSSGLYLYRIQVGSETMSRKMTLLK